MKKVAIIGTQGVPASYGGFETLVENIIGENCSNGIQYTIFCSSKDMPERMDEYKGARLKYVPLKANGVQSIPYDIISMMRSISGYDAVLVLGVSGCIFLPIFKLFCRKKVIVNIDGLEYRRAKWKGWVKRFLKLSEKIAVRFADVIITDNKGIQDYVLQEYKKETTLIAYGGNHALIDTTQEREAEIMKQYGLEKGNFSMCVCRIEPENNCHLTLEAFKNNKEKLVFIGNWNRNGYSKNLKEEYGGCSNIILLESIYDLNILYTLRKNTRFYIHGHSAGGTNPSLVEAMFFGRPILAFDVIYNRETTGNKAHYYKSIEELQELVSQKVDNGKVLQNIAQERYTWAQIASEYEALY